MKVLFCCGMSRSEGTHQYQIAAEVVSRLGIGKGVGFGTNLHKSLDGEGWVVCKKEKPESWMVDAATMAIGIYRDPRDVVCSFMRWRGEQGKYDNFEDALEETIRAVLWFMQWEPLCDYVSYYELFNAAYEARIISSLFGKRLSINDAKEIAELYTIEKNRETMNYLRAEGHWMDPHSMLTAAHIGSEGGRSVWREVLTESQVDQIEYELGFWMETHGYVCHLDGVE